MGFGIGYVFRLNIKFKFMQLNKNVRAALAQLAERKTEDLEVAGSTPAGGINFFFINFIKFNII